MVDVAAGGDHDARVHVVGVVVAAHGVEVERRQRLGVADDRPPERVLAEDDLAEVVVDELGRRVLVHRHLFEHDLALLVEVGERGPRDHLGDDLERLVEVLVQEPRVDQRVLLGGRRVGLGAHVVEDVRDVGRRVLVRALEDQVLDEVGDAAELDRLEPGAGGDPDPEGHRAHAVHALGGHSQAVVQR